MSVDRFDFDEDAPRFVGDALEWLWALIRTEDETGIVVDTWSPDGRGIVALRVAWEPLIERRVTYVFPGFEGYALPRHDRFGDAEGPWALVGRPPDVPVPSRDRQKAKIPAKLRWEIFKRDGFRCLHCGTQDNLSADHIVAESKGGPTTLENLQTLCRPCNSRKGTR